MAVPELEDEELVFRVVDDVLMPRVMPAPIERWPALVRDLPPGLRGLWGVWTLEGQVHNGGFLQYFWNDSRRYVAQAREGYAMIGADRHLALMNEAVRRFEAQRGRLRPPPERRPVEGLLDRFSKVATEGDFDDLDTEFFTLDSMPLLAAYIREHPDGFLV